MQGLRRGRVVTLLLTNLGGTILCFPAIAFMMYFDLLAVPKFLVITWVGVTLLALVLWPVVARAHLLVALALSIATVYLPPAIAWGILMRGLSFEGWPTPGELAALVQDAAILGGIFTAAYWAPFGIANCWLLRRANHAMQPAGEQPAVGR